MKREVSSVLVTVLFVTLLVLVIGIGVYYWVFLDKYPVKVVDQPVVEKVNYDVTKNVN